MYYREGQSSATVAEALGLTPATVDQRLSRGRKYLRSQVEELVTRSLCRSKPSEKFSAAVLAGLPVGQAGAAAQPIASSTVAVAAKGGTMKTIAVVSLLGLAGLATSMNMCSVDDDESAKPQARVAAAKPAASSDASANDSHDARREQHWREQARAEARRENASRAAYVLTRISPESVGVNLEGGPSPLTGPASIGLEEPEPAPPVRTLTGRVIDDAGSGAADAIVLVGPPRMPGLGATLLASHGAQTDANGRFRIELRSDEALPVMALHRERGWSVSEQIPAGPSDAEVELLLEPAPRLQGTVSQDGSPTPASITLESDRPPLTFFTDADGAFDIVAPAGAYRVRIRPGADLRDRMRLESPGLVRAFEAGPGRVDTWNVDLPLGALVALRVDQPWERGFAQVEYVLVIGRHEIETLEALDTLRADPETRFLQHLVGGVDLDAPARFVDLHAGPHTVCALGMDHPDVLAFECRVLDVNEDDNLEITLDPHAND